MDVFWIVAPRSRVIRTKIKGACTSETSVNFYRTTRRWNPEDSHLCTHSVRTSNPTEVYIVQRKYNNANIESVNKYVDLLLEKRVYCCCRYQLH
jgi:hypothetical protein